MGSVYLSSFKNKQRIVLYGLGTETKKAITELEDKYEIVGLLDGFKDTGEMYGKHIISLEDVPSLDVSEIIVVARPGSCKAITKRIGQFCIDNNIALFDIRGKNLLEETKVSFNLKELETISKKVLLDKIAIADAISFDLFDTLIMRRVFCYTDVFELVDDQLRKQGIEIDDFSNKRLQAEKELSKNCSPTLEEIYKSIVGDDELSKVVSEIEYEIDSKTLCVRRDMVDIFQGVIKSGKTVYITTDTYYSRKRIVDILDRFNISGYSDVLVSCEYNIGKRQGLFKELKDVVSMSCNHAILHIGDDIVSDIEAASNAGLESFKIYNAEEMFDAVGGFGLEQYIETISDRVKVGMMNSVLFNSPFMFENEDKRIVLNGAEDIGYVICSPIISDFVMWLTNEVNENEIKNVWLSARDGFLIEQLYKMLGEKGTYFLTSRIAAIRAGVESVADIEYVDSMRYFGDVKENVKVRFGIDVDDKCIDTKASCLTDYADVILENSIVKKKNYIKYLDELEIGDGDIAFFDFVAKGTTQMYVQRLTDHHIKGLYFLQLEPEFMKDKGLDIKPFYSKEEKDESAIYDNYYILETLLTAPHPQVLEFDDIGKHIYAEELRSEKDLNCFEMMQQGVKNYFEQYINMVPEQYRTINKQLDEKILSLIHGLKIEDEEFLSLMVEDPFFNRMTNVKDLV